MPLFKVYVYDEPEYICRASTQLQAEEKVSDLTHADWNEIWAQRFTLPQGVSLEEYLRYNWRTLTYLE